MTASCRRLRMQIELYVLLDPRPRRPAPPSPMCSAMPTNAEWRLHATAKHDHGTKKHKNYRILNIRNCNNRAACTTAILAKVCHFCRKHDNGNTHTHPRLMALFRDHPGEPVPERWKQSGFYWSKRHWVAVASAGPYASLHLAPDR